MAEWAYEDSGAAIHLADTGASGVDEPQSLALLALGAGGVASAALGSRDRLMVQLDDGARTRFVTLQTGTAEGYKARPMSVSGKSSPTNSKSWPATRAVA